MSADPQTLNGPVPSQLVAEQLLWLRRDIATTPMHILKLVYICHGWMLGFTGRPLVQEYVEAWRYGPVIPRLYHLYKSFRGNPIKVGVQDRGEEFDNEQRTLIEIIDREYRDSGPWELSDLTHQPGTPWDVVRHQYGIGTIIPNPIIQEYYNSWAEKRSPDYGF